MYNIGCNIALLLSQNFMLLYNERNMTSGHLENNPLNRTMFIKKAIIHKFIICYSKT